jgi:uncharacterized protein with HEPN domain
MKTVLSYLHDILTAISRIQTDTQEGKEAFFVDTKTQDAVNRNFEIIGEVVKRIPKTILNTQPQIPWQDVAGFRDVLIHEYHEVDLEEVWLVIEQDLANLRQAIEALISTLENSPSTDE